MARSFALLFLGLLLLQQLLSIVLVVHVELELFEKSGENLPHVLVVRLYLEVHSSAVSDVLYKLGREALT